jgi:hypothetical protein
LVQSATEQKFPVANETRQSVAEAAEEAAETVAQAA